MLGGIPHKTSLVPLHDAAEHWSADPWGPFAARHGAWAGRGGLNLPRGAPAPPAPVWAVRGVRFTLRGLGREESCAWQDYARACACAYRSRSLALGFENSDEQGNEQA
jgi:hypothetical protein